MMSYEYQIFANEVPQEVHWWCYQTQLKEGGVWSPQPIEPSEQGEPRWQILPDSIIDPDAWKHHRINELQQFLNDTDWYCSRYVDIGTPIPDDIKQQRSDARIEIDRLRHELEPVADEVNEPTEPQLDEEPTD